MFFPWKKKSRRLIVEVFSINKSGKKAKNGGQKKEGKGKWDSGKYLAFA